MWALFCLSGYGVFVLKPFQKGDFILEYVGERMEGGEIEERYKIFERKKMRHFYQFFYTTSNSVVKNWLQQMVLLDINLQCGLGQVRSLRKPGRNIVFFCPQGFSSSAQPRDIIYFI